MSEHYHHWVLINGYNNAYTCCECGATKGDKRVITELRPVHSRRPFAGGSRKFTRRQTTVGAHRAL